MSPFRSPEEFREVMDRTFELMSADPDMGSKLRDADAPQRFEFPDLGLVVNITGVEEVEEGGLHLRWEWSDEVAWDPAVEMTMDSEIANRYFQGKENVAVALARRRIRSKGSPQKTLALIPMTKPVFARYRQMVERHYPHLAE
ncbi:MAG TPA: hypothetical protein VEQ61_05465 [Thermoleophilaceae bacterium]|nr:hypothetical protein [Thermoleophilaceae bacterium]